MFTVIGLPIGSTRLVAEVSWSPPDDRDRVSRPRRGLAGNPLLVHRALARAASGLPLAATPTGPRVAPDLDDPVSAFLIVTSLFEPGYRVAGEPPEIDVSIPDGAVS